MIKLQVGKITFQKLIIYYLVSLIFTFFVFRGFIFKESFNFKNTIFPVLIFSIFPGTIASIGIMEIVKMFFEAFKEKNYIFIFVTVIFIIWSVKYFF